MRSYRTCSDPPKATAERGDFPVTRGRTVPRRDKALRSPKLQCARKWSGRAFQRRGIRVQRVLTDNGGAYRSRPFRKACRWLGIATKRTRPYRPQTNGKAERFIQTLQRKWAYAVPYATSEQRRAALPAWLRFYNEDRPHASLNRQTPLSRLAQFDEQRS